jgi:hypothetical protein
MFLSLNSAFSLSLFFDFAWSDLEVEQQKFDYFFPKPLSERCVGS